WRRRRAPASVSSPSGSARRSQASRAPPGSTGRLALLELPDQGLEAVIAPQRGEVVGRDALAHHLLDSVRDRLLEQFQRLPRRVLLDVLGEVRLAAGGQEVLRAERALADRERLPFHRLGLPDPFAKVEEVGQ